MTATTANPAAVAVAATATERIASFHQPQHPRHDLRIVPRVFVFYSNKLGCLGSVALSVVLSAVVILILALINGWF